MEETSVLLKYGHPVIHQIVSLGVTIFLFYAVRDRKFGNMPEMYPCISLVERAVALGFSNREKKAKRVFLRSHGLSHHTFL